MRYDEMKRLYPWIDQFFEQAAGQVHAGSTPEMSMGYIRRDLEKRIRPAHLEAVTAKLEKFARLVQENIQAKPPPGTVYLPGVKTIAENMKENGLCICDFCEEYYCRLCGFRRNKQ